MLIQYLLVVSVLKIKLILKWIFVGRMSSLNINLMAFK